MLTTVGYLKPDDLQARVSLNNIHLSPTFDACKEMEVTIKFFPMHCQYTLILSLQATVPLYNIHLIRIHTFLWLQSKWLAKILK